MKRLNVILLSIILTVYANAQTARLYTSDSGLANSHIYSICQDSRGFIWISTENGLSRFDGMDFSTFNFDRDNPNTLASDLVLTLFEDSRGTYWVGTSAGLQIFDTEYNTFSSIDLGDPDVPASDQHISSIIEADICGSRFIIAASSGHGLYPLDPDTGTISGDFKRELDGHLPSPFIKSLFTDSQERLWVALENGGICIIDLKSGKEVEGIKTDERLDDASVTSFAEDEYTGNILLGTSSHGILIFDSSLNTIRRAKDISSRECKVESLLRNIDSDKYGDGNFIAGLENEGIKLFRTSDEKMTEISIPEVSFDMSSWKVHCLMEDSQGNLWIGAFQTGLMVVPKSMYGFESVQLGESGRFGTTATCITSVVEDTESGALWIGTDGSGLFRIDRNGEKASFTNMNSPLSNNSIMALTTDKRGDLWIATYLDGLYRWSRKDGFRKFKDDDGLNTSKTVCLTYSEKYDVLYVGTHGQGMSVVSPTEEKVLDTYADDDNKWVNSLYISRDGTLWIGTYNGPMCYDHKSKQLAEYEIDEHLSKRIYTFCESLDGKMWLGTGEGLVCLDLQTGEASSYTEDDGLPDNVVNNIQEGNDGNLWIATMNGLSRLNPSTGTFKNYYQHDGLQENEFHACASYKAADGKLYFGGIKGLSSFYPHIVDQRSYPVPALYFSDFSVMNEPVNYDPELGEDNVLDKHITEASQITLPHSKNIFSIKFSVLEYTNPRKIMYAYMMEGFDNSWNYTGPDARLVTYTNIPSGRYTMKVKAFFDGTPSEFSYKEIGIRIMPPWYKSPTAYILYLMAAALLAYGVVLRLRKEKIRRKEKEESEIKEMKLKMFTNLSHEIRTPLTLVMNPLKKMREAEQDMKQKELYNLMYRNCLRILRLVNQLLDMRKVDNGQMQLHFLETDVVYFIKDIMKSFDNLAVSRGIRFSISSANEVVNLWIDQGNFDKIIFNILSNAFKHTPDNGSISISICEAKSNNGVLEHSVKEYVEFVIENTGRGVEEQYLDKIFDRFFQTDVHDAKIGSGVGLHLTKMLAELHHGKITAFNTEKGMAFSLLIPVGFTHLSQLEMTRPTNHKDLYTKNPILDKEHFESREDVTHSPVQDSKDSARHVKSKRKLILVDDDNEMRAYLKLELQSSYNVEVCSNAKEAWSRITDNIPDAVVTDLIMDGMDGAELCEKIKKNPGTNHIPVIILTSSSDENNQQKCIDSGADRFFTKPISLEILKSTIANAITTRDTIRNKYNKEIDYKLNELHINDSSNTLVNKVISIIRKNMENSEFSVEDLSHEVGISRVHLNRKLKETMNISPSNLIKSIRLKQAAFLLINNKVNISEVAYKVGFSTHSYFSNSFHDYFGLTPTEFVAKYMDCKDEETLNRILK